MTTPTSPMEPFSPFLPTTYNVPEEPDRLDVFLVDNLANLSDVINDKVIGGFTQATETINGKKFAYDTTKKTRPGSQAMARIPQYPNSGTLTLTVNTMPVYPIKDINPQFVVSQVWGSASKPCSAVNAGDGDYFSFYGSGNAKITFTMSDTTIVITTTQDMRDYSGFIFIDFIRDGT